MDTFGEDKTPGALIENNFYFSMKPNERIKDFNQIFTTILNKFKDIDKTIGKIEVEVYCNALPTYMSMFIKREEKETFVETFEMAKNIEREMISCKENPIKK